jgi:EAL domain-containing protein (putative c-di-GMP-specific phosphodiesterase class I)
MDANMLRLPDGLESLDLTREGRIEDTRVVNNTMQIFGREITVVLARRIAVLGAVFCLLAAVLPAWSLYKDWRASDVSRIQVQYHPLLVDIQEGSLPPGTDQVVDVSSFADLIKMAERYGAMIFHENKGSFHRYSVQDEQVVYQYILDGTSGETLFPDAYAFKRSLLEGLKEDQFELYYQPVMAVKDKKVLSVEAFLRWNHPQHGTIYPVDFIELAESGDLIPEIDTWVSRKVCQQLQEWRDQEIPVVPVSINLSPETVVDVKFVHDFQEALLQTVCKPELIQVEINRSNRAFQEKRFQEHLRSLADLGIGLAIDNFATDDANQINQVFQVPIQSLKIDRSVVQGMRSDSHARQLVGAVAAMAKKFQVQVVAQGVETEEDLDLLKEQGIEIAQGFYLGKPIRPDELGSLLADQGQAIRPGK